MIAVLLQWEPNQEPGTRPRINIEMTDDPTEIRDVLERRAVFDDLAGALAFIIRVVARDRDG